MSVLQKINYLLNRKQKIQLIFLSFLLLLGTLLEMVSLSVLVPTLEIMSKNNIGEKYPFLKPLLNKLGNPSQSRLILIIMIFIVILFIFKGLFLVFLNWKQSDFSAKLSSELSIKLYTGYLKQPYHFHLQKNSSILNFNISEAASLSGFSNTIMIGLLETTVILGIISMLFLVEPIGALSVSLFLLLSGLAFHRFTKNKILNWSKNRQFHVGQGNKQLMQGFGGVKDIKLMGNESFFINSYSKHIIENATISTKATTLNLVPRLYLEVLAVFAMAGLVVSMIIQGKSVDLIVPVLGIFLVAAFRMIPSANRIMTSVQTLKSAYPTIDLVYNEFKLINNSSSDKKTGIYVDFNDQIEMNNISFSYTNSKKVLSDINIKISKGKSIGIIGPSGSGKSTLVDLILGLLSPTSGSIKIDGIDINNVMTSWQNKIGYVPQSIYLTDDTIKNNIAFGLPENQINNESISRVIKIAQLGELIDSLPEGLDTKVGERGVRLSGGQRQRIGIARALYHEPSILVLDEATSALDTNTEIEVMKAVNSLHGKKTLIIIAHRLSTVNNCDLIYKISSGKIIEVGNPNIILTSS